MNRDQLLQLIVPEAQRPLLVDFLLAQPQTPFFTVIEAEGFGQPHEQLSAVEQVAGAQQKVKFEVELNETEIAPLLTRLKETYPTLSVFYRILPIVKQGVL